MKSNGENGDNPASSTADQVADDLADIDLNDPELSRAASKIQAQFRGFKIGGKKKSPEKEEEVKQKETEEPPAATEEGQTQSAEDDELADIDLTDPELEKAALKIQSTFKGFKVRGKK